MGAWATGDFVVARDKLLLKPSFENFGRFASHYSDMDDFIQDMDVTEGVLATLFADTSAFEATKKESAQASERLHQLMVSIPDKTPSKPFPVEKREAFFKECSIIVRSVDAIGEGLGTLRRAGDLIYSDLATAATDLAEKAVFGSTTGLAIAALVALWFFTRK